MLYFLIVIAVLLSPLGALWLYRLATPLRIRSLPERWSHSSEVIEDPLAGLAVAANTPIFEHAGMDVLTNGVEIFPAMLEAIDEATDTIHLATFVYWKGEIAERFAEGLAKAAKRGVEVRVLLDGFGSLDMEEDLAEEMRRAGCRVEIFHPLRWRSLHRSNFRTHRKILVIDGRVGFTGGVGIAEEWDGNAEGPGSWRDTHFRLTGPIVRYLHSAFDENWRVTTGEFVAWEDCTRDEDRGDVRVVPLLGCPGIGLSKMALAVWFVSRCSKERLWIQTPYLVPSEAIVESLCARARDGVDVRIMVPGPHRDHESVGLLGQNFYRPFLEAGIRVLEYQRTMLHSKILISDDDLVLVGSANLDHRSFELNYEMQLAVQSERIHDRLSSSFLADERHCREVTPEDLDSWTSRTRLAMWGMRIFRHHL